MHDKIDKSQIEKSISEGVGYLMSCQRDDGGLKFENESSTISGIWTTAECLEFLLSSKYVPITAFNKVSKMLDFILSTQRDDGSWPVLMGENPGQHQMSSTIATGHCIYVLRLSSVGNFLNYQEQSRTETAIRKGKTWLKGCIVEKNGYGFWPGQYSTEQLDPTRDERTRMDYVFSTFYAMMAFLPINGTGKDSIILDKVYRFFVSQAEWFCDSYEEKDCSQLDDATISKIASSICRITSALFMLKNGSIPSALKERIVKATHICSKNPFITTGIDVNTQSPGFSVQEFNNNTPFDYGMALMWLETDAVSLKAIIDQYLRKQTTDGGWYLNFSSTFSRKVWTTAEALMVLEKSLDKYNEVAYKMDLEEVAASNNHLESKISELEDNNNVLRSSIETLQNSDVSDRAELNRQINELKENNKRLTSQLKDLRIDRIISAVITFCLALVIVIYVCLQIANKNTAFSSPVINGVVVPTALAALYDVGKLIMTLVKKGIQDDD